MLGRLTINTGDCTMGGMYDLIIVGGGPAGLSAAINAASEGLKVVVLDSNPYFGGQAKESTAIENLFGFPNGISGEQLISASITQTHKFCSDLHCPANVVAIKKKKGKRVIITDDGRQYVSSAVILSMGLHYRRLAVEGIGHLMGRGVYYGYPQYVIKDHCNIAVIGGANSAGQAVVHLSKNEGLSIFLLVRGSIDDKMSRYLVSEVKKCSNVEILEDCACLQLIGQEHLTGIMTSKKQRLNVDFLFILIGGVPKTYWLEGTILLNEKKFILTYPEIRTGDLKALPYETSMPGVFACGDVRCGSIKRISAAIGEGASALQMVHLYLER